MQRIASVLSKDRGLPGIPAKSAAVEISEVCHLIQVVPRLWPAQCGVSDHAIALAAELKKSFGIESSFVVLNSDDKADLPYRITHCPPHRLIDACASVANNRSAALLAHVSGYGYSTDGAPVLLAQALEQAKTDGRFPIAVFFHELHASGMPWTKAFWHAERQKRAYRRIARACDFAVTSAQVFATWLERETAAPVQCMPVFSQVGETAEPPPFANRNRSMAVFGLAATKQRVYAELDKLASTLQKLGVREIMDVGPAIETSEQVSGIPVKRAGVLPADEIDCIFARTAFGYLAYPPNCLAKSGVFAAYAAHGMIPIIAQGFREERDGLRDGVHLLSAQTAPTVNADDLDECSKSAWRWYSEHRLRDHAELYDRWLNTVGQRATQTTERAHG
jgi:hypothetical protein